MYASIMATWNCSRVQMNEPELETLPSHPKPKRNCDRNFVMLGKVNSGKSTLSNLLIGSKDKIHFPVHLKLDAIGMTKKVKMKATIIESSIVFKDTCEKLIFQITDLPGTNDPAFTDDKQCHNVLKSIKQSRSEFSDTFLIVCDISGKFFSNEEMISILNIAVVLSHSGYMFFQNAILVFTHADMYDIPQERLNEMLKTESWASVLKLLESIENRHLLINSLDQSEKNRNSLIESLFELSKPTLNVAITGNNGSQSSQLRDILNFHKNTIIRNESDKVNIEYFFNSDICNQFDTLTNELRVEDELKRMFIISKGISVMVVLISLVDAFTGEFYSLINKIPETFSLQKSENIKNDPFWKYSFILFLSPTDDKHLVEKIVKRNDLLKKIISRVENRFTWVTKDTNVDECHERLVNMVLKVNHDTLGTSFSSNTIVSRISEDIKSSQCAKKLERVNENDSQRNRIQRNIPCFKDQASSSSKISSNSINWNKDEISRSTKKYIPTFKHQNITRFEHTSYWRRYVKSEAEIYNYPDEPIPTEGYKDFLGTFLGDRYIILVHGNSAAKSSKLFEILQLSNPNNQCTQTVQGRLEFYAYPDLDLFNQFREPQIDDTIKKLISDSRRISLFIIMISQTEIFSNNMKEMITDLPKSGQFSSEEYFWNHATILFSFEDKIVNNHKEVLKSIKGNVAIREVVEKAGKRYIWMSNSTTNDELQDNILSQCRKVEVANKSQLQV